MAKAQIQCKHLPYSLHYTLSPLVTMKHESYGYAMALGVLNL